MPSTITGCVSVAEKTSQTWLLSGESGSLMRTVKIAPCFMVNGGETKGVSCANTMPVTEMKVTTSVKLRRAQEGIMFIVIPRIDDQDLKLLWRSRFPSLLVSNHFRFLDYPHVRSDIRCGLTN